MSDNMNVDEFEPKIICFLCTWWAYAAADLAGVSRLQYPSNVRTIRVMCSGSVSPHHILKAFQTGVDGVFVGGWHLGECNYQYGNYSTEKRVAVLQKLMSFSGLDAKRLKASWISSAEAPELVHELKSFIDEVRELGPSPLGRDNKTENVA